MTLDCSSVSTTLRAVVDGRLLPSDRPLAPLQAVVQSLESQRFD